MNQAVDVLLPTHRRPHTIRYSIEAILGQTHADVRLHVVGDGCDDDTEAVVRSIPDPRVHFYRYPKAMGLGYGNRNQVLRATTGRFVAYATDDDLWFPDHLERGIRELREQHLALVAFRECPVRVPDAPDPYFFALDWHLGSFSSLLRRWFTGSGVCVHERWVFDKVGYWNDSLARFGDREFLMRVMQSGAPSAHVDYVTLLRFYALHWDALYSALDDPPQKRYLARLQDAEWRHMVRQAVASGPRPLAVRKRQWQDFLRFAIRSGPRFVRFWLQASRRSLR